MHRQTQSASIAPGHKAENAPLNVMWVRVSVCASCFGRAAVYKVFFARGDRESATSHKERTRGSANTKGKPLPIPKHIASYRTASWERLTSSRLFLRAVTL